MESLARAERLRELQARNAERAAATGQDYESLLADIRRAYKSGTPGQISVPGPVAVPVVFDVNVLVLAVAVGEAPFRRWPPPTSGNPSADGLGVVNDAAEFALWLSPHILANTGRVLAAALKTPEDEVDEQGRTALINPFRVRNKVRGINRSGFRGRLTAGCLRRFRAIPGFRSGQATEGALDDIVTGSR
jgi:hypothetical protein